MTKYVKFISETEVETVPKDKDGIFNYDLDISRITEDGYKPLIEEEEPIGTNRRYNIRFREDTDSVVKFVNWLETEEEYEQRIANERREYLDNLSLTSADVERAIYADKGMNFKDLVEMLQQMEVPGLDIKQLDIELRANDFFRNHPYISMIGNILGYTSEDLDFLFEYKAFPVKE